MSPPHSFFVFVFKFSHPFVFVFKFSHPFVFVFKFSHPPPRICRYRSPARAMAMRLCCGGGNAEEIGSIISAACSREDWAQALFFCFLIPDISQCELQRQMRP